MNDTPNNPASRRRSLRSLSSWTGMGAAAAITLYLMLASAAPKWLAGTLGVTLFAPNDSVQRELFRWPGLLAMAAVFFAALVVATVVAVPLNLRNAGAWCSHLGLVVLGIGAGWYALASESGDSIAIRHGSDWTAIGYVYIDRSFALYVSDAADPNAGPVQQRLDGLVPHGRPRDIDVAVRPSPEGVSIRAVRFLPEARVGSRWADASPNRIPAVELAVADEGQGGTVLLSPSLPDHQHVAGRGYVLTYRAGITPEGLAKLTTPTDANRAPGMPYDLAMAVTGSGIAPTLVVVHPDGSRWHGLLEVGKALEAPLAGRKVGITLQALLDHAAEIHELAPPHDHQSHAATDESEPAIGPVVQVEVKVGNWWRETFVPFIAYEEFAPPQMMDLPGNRAIWLNFSRRRAALPATLQIESATYETYPASGIPKDYICKVSVVAGARRTSETLSLNNPVTIGGFQFSQGSWGPPGSDRPTQIVFGAASRPGLPVIWLGCILICLGMPYAFYAKPLLMRRRGAPQ